LRDAGRVNLGVAGVGKESAFFVGFPVGRNRAPHGVGGEIENVDVPACAKADGVGSITLHLAGYQVAHRDAARHAVDDNQIEHFAAVIHLDRAGLDLAGKSGVSAQQELLAGLATREERTGNLGAAEGAVVKVAGVVAGKRHTLCDALVDDVVGHLGKTPYVSLAGTEVAPFDGVVEQTIDRIAVIRIVLGGIDAALCGDGVSAARAVLIAESLDVVAKFSERRSGSATGKAGTDDDHVI